MGEVTGDQVTGVRECPPCFLPSKGGTAMVDPASPGLLGKAGGGGTKGHDPP